MQPIESPKENPLARLSCDRTPREIVGELDRYIVGQDPAKKAVAIAIRNRWRRQQLPEEVRREVAPKNILMMGPTGVGKTEIARRLARLTGAPFIKVDATKYTEVGYYGRDVESMVRELVENAIVLVREQEMQHVEQQANERVEERLLDLLCPPPVTLDVGVDQPDAQSHYQNTREKMRVMLRSHELDQRTVEITVQKKSSMPMMVGNLGADMDMGAMFEQLLPKASVHRAVTVKEAHRILLEETCESLLDQEKINAEAIELAENLGIIFLDEIDKVVASDGKNADVSRQGVQRDLLPIVEGTSVQTRYGYISTHHVLFIAAGAFHRTSPSDLMPELQGRFPIRVDLADLTKDDFVRILTEPRNSLTSQYTSLMGTEGVELEFAADGIQAIADYAFHVNQGTQNIGARRLYTMMEKLLEELGFEAPDMSMGRVVVNRSYVEEKLKDIAADEDLSRFIL